MFNVPKLRFGEFEGEWVEKKLGDVADIYDGTHQTPKYVKSGIPFVSVENIYNIDKTNKCITEDAFKKEYKIKPQKDDILMTRITAGIIGATAIVKDNKPLAFYVSLALIRKKNNLVITSYLNHFINSVSFKKELHKRIIHIAFPKKINLGEIGKCSLFYSSLNEQQKIATFLTSIDQKIEQLNKKKTLLESYKKGVMQKIFSQEIRFKRDNGGEFEDWEEKRLGEISIITMGQSPDSKSYNNEEDGMYLIQGNADIQNRKSKPRNWTNKPTKVCQIGDLILTVRAPVGAIAKSLHNACIGRGVCSIRNNEFSKIEYLYQYLLWFEPRWISLEQGSTFTAVGTKDIKSLKIPLPCLKEQQKIATFLTSIDQKITQTNQALEEMKAFKKGLLQQMFV